MRPCLMLQKKLKMKGNWATARAQAPCIITLLAHFALSALADTYHLDAASFVAAMMLVYAFVFAFPLHPLDGKEIWDFSKLLWLLLFGLCMAAFLNRGLSS